jgi:Asp-tRNA(Asn)/Glu-tRNA(Gln) amidotransferase A subunit family amidase
MLDNFIPPYDGAVVEKLRAAGAVVHAKTNMDEFAMGATGESSFFGPTKNPWNPALVPGGSSSGSAAIVAYGGVPAALGSDTGGSIRQPAAFCGLVGLKPTYGRVSRHGVGALVSSLDQVGPIARNARDTALLMDIITGHDGRDSTSAKQADTAAPCLAGIEDGIKGVRIGIDKSLTERDGFTPVMAEAFRKSVDLAQDAGAEIVDVTLPHVDYLVAAYYIINVCEASANMTRFDGVRYGERIGDGDLWEVYAETRGTCFGDEVKRRIMMGAYALSKGYYDAYYLRAARVRRLFSRETEKLFGQADAATPCLPHIEEGIKGLRIGIDKSLEEREGFTPVMAEAFRRGVELAKDAGAEIVELTLPHTDYLVATYYIINVCEASANMTRFDGVRYGERVGDGDLWEVYEETRGACLGDEVKRRIMMGAYALSKGYYDAYYRKAARVRRLVAQETAALFGSVDAVLMPVSPAQPGRVGAEAGVLENYLADIFTIPASLAGVPSIAYPVGLFGGLPVGVQAMGPAFAENTLCRIARAAEKSVSLPDAPWMKATPEEAK